MCVFLISPVPIAEPLTSELIDTPVFHNLAPRPIKYRVSVPIPIYHQLIISQNHQNISPNHYITNLSYHRIIKIYHQIIIITKLSYHKINKIYHQIIISPTYHFRESSKYIIILPNYHITESSKYITKSSYHQLISQNHQNISPTYHITESSNISYINISKYIINHHITNLSYHRIIKNITKSLYHQLISQNHQNISPNHYITNLSYHRIIKISPNHHITPTYITESSKYIIKSLYHQLIISQNHQNISPNHYITNLYHKSPNISIQQSPTITQNPNISPNHYITNYITESSKSTK